MGLRVCSRKDLPFGGSLLWFLYIVPQKGRSVGPQAGFRYHGEDPIRFYEGSPRLLRASVSVLKGVVWVRWVKGFRSYTPLNPAYL